MSTTYLSGFIMGGLVGFLAAFWLILAYANNYFGNRR